MMRVTTGASETEPSSRRSESNGNGDRRRPIANPALENAKRGKTSLAFLHGPNRRPIPRAILMVRSDQKFGFSLSALLIHRFDMAGSLYLTLSLLGVGSEMAETTARWVLSRSTRKTSLVQRKLARLEAAETITVAADPRMDRRILRLTEQARCRLLGGVDPEAEWKRCWDGVWRLVVFDIPESSRALRTQLRRRLRECRFGWLQNSVWISPHPVDAFRQELGETGLVPESLTYFAARPVGGESPAALVNSAWDFGGLARNYADYRGILRLRPDPSSGLSTGWFRWLEMEHRAWQRIAGRDPFLPFELQPSGYPGQAAWAERRKAFQGFTRMIAESAKLGAGESRASDSNA
jgi:phenylacetic acid degradation operon negative regulatory protein